MTVKLHIAVWGFAMCSASLISGWGWFRDPVYYVGLGFFTGILLDELFR